MARESNARLKAEKEAPSQDVAVQAMMVCLAARVPAIVWGGPGEGKTEIIREIARRWGMYFERPLASRSDPADWGGFPVVDPETSELMMKPPPWGRRMVDAQNSVKTLRKMERKFEETAHAEVKSVLAQRKKAADLSGGLFDLVSDDAEGGPWFEEKAVVDHCAGCEDCNKVVHGLVKAQRYYQSFIDFNEAHSRPDNGSIGFLDEFNTALPIQQATALAVLDSLRIGDTYLGDHSRLIAAANHPDIAVNGQEMAAPTTSRFCHIYWAESDDEPFIQGMLHGGRGHFPIPKVPSLTKDVLRRADEIREDLSIKIGLFLKANPTLAYRLPNTTEGRSMPFPTRRTWVFAAELVAMARALGFGADVEGVLIKGAVGMGPYAEFTNFLYNNDLQDPEVLLQNPDKTISPRDPSHVMATGMAVALAVQRKNTVARQKAAWAVLDRLSQEKNNDSLLDASLLLVTCIKDFSEMESTLAKSKVASSLNALSELRDNLKKQYGGKSVGE